MTNDKFHDLFGGDPRSPESRITQKEMDIARSLQDVTEEVVLNLSKRALERCSSKNLCLAGGVALNCVANGKILKQITDKLWIQPAAGDAGGALGAALYYHFNEQNNPRNLIKGQFDMMQGSYLGPSFTNEVVEEELVKLNAVYSRHEFSDLTSIISNKLIEGSVVGWFQGRMEFGPRALGNRSIIGDARNTEMQKIMNLKIKYRESFRPFAPAVLEEKVSDYFEINTVSPYMLLVSQVKDEIKLNVENFNLFGIDQLNLVRSKLPSVTHVDYSARIQTVNKYTNARFYDLIKDFYDKTGSAVLINTSFNVRGEPIVCSVEDAFLCFMRTEMDVLVINDFILIKNEQHDYDDDKKWMKQYELD
jgi:carbamoyltransferase